jgi:hypothetical protein
MKNAFNPLSEARDCRGYSWMGFPLKYQASRFALNFERWEPVCEAAYAGQFHPKIALS